MFPSFSIAENDEKHRKLIGKSITTRTVVRDTSKALAYVDPIDFAHLVLMPNLICFPWSVVASEKDEEIINVERDRSKAERTLAQAEAAVQRDKDKLADAERELVGRSTFLDFAIPTFSKDTTS